MALLYPGARWTPLGSQTEALMSAHDIVCVHTMVGYLVSTDGYFKIGNGVGYAGTESHYGVGGKWGPDLGGDLDGSVWQWQDRARRADANLDGNYRVISIETADNAARPIQPWTPAQLSALISLIAWECSPAAHADCPTSWLCHQEGIPTALIPDTQPGRRGIAYHAQGAGEHISGEWWSTSRTKDCPTAVRISQLRQTVIPGVIANALGVEDDLFDATDRAQLRELMTRVKHIEAMVPGFGATLGTAASVNAGKSEVRDAAGLAATVAASGKSEGRAAAQLVATADAKSAVMKALESAKLMELTEDEVQRLGASIAAALDALPTVPE